MKKCWRSLTNDERSRYKQRVKLFRKVWVQDLDPDTDSNLEEDELDESTKRDLEEVIILEPEEAKHPLRCYECDLEFHGIEAFIEHLSRIKATSHKQCPVSPVFLACKKIPGTNLYIYFPLQICSREPSKLLLHIMKHAGYIHLCKRCSSVQNPSRLSAFKERSLLKKHMKSKHMFPCEICLRVFKTRKLFKNHR